MRLLSWKWWFENRETGAITIAQPPNWPLIAVLGVWVIRLIADNDSSLHDVAGYGIIGLLLYWGTDELVRGVNPWRRVLGAGVIILQLVQLLS